MPQAWTTDAQTPERAKPTEPTNKQAINRLSGGEKIDEGLRGAAEQSRGPLSEGASTKKRSDARPVLDLSVARTPTGVVPSESLRPLVPSESRLVVKRAATVLPGLTIVRSFSMSGSFALKAAALGL